MNAMQVVTVVVIIILSIAAVKTLIPNAEASKPCLFGYYASCSFAPLSTAVLVLVAVAIFVAARRVAIL